MGQGHHLEDASGDALLLHRLEQEDRAHDALPFSTLPLPYVGQSVLTVGRMPTISPSPGLFLLAHVGQRGVAGDTGAGEAQPGALFAQPAVLYQQAAVFGVERPVFSADFPAFHAFLAQFPFQDLTAAAGFRPFRGRKPTPHRALAEEQPCRGYVKNGAQIDNKVQIRQICPPFVTAQRRQGRLEPGGKITLGQASAYSAEALLQCVHAKKSQATAFASPYGRPARTRAHGCEPKPIRGDITIFD